METLCCETCGLLQRVDELPPGGVTAECNRCGWTISKAPGGSLGRVRAHGPTITIRFKDAAGVKAGETLIQHLGVPIGLVNTVELTDDLEHVLVTARLRRAPVSVAREGSKAPRAKNGMTFPLFDEPIKEWLAWSPKIPVPPEK